MTSANKEHFNQSLMSNPGKHGHDFAAYEHYTRGAALHPGTDLHPGVFLHQGAKILHMNTALPISESGFILLETFAVFEANAIAWVASYCRRMTGHVGHAANKRSRYQIDDEIIE